jgi:hypothetical protein
MKTKIYGVSGFNWYGLAVKINNIDSLKWTVIGLLICIFTYAIGDIQKQNSFLTVFCGLICLFVFGYSLFLSVIRTIICCDLPEWVRQKEVLLFFSFLANIFICVLSLKFGLNLLNR